MIAARPVGRVLDANCALLGLPGRLRWMMGFSGGIAVDGTDEGAAFRTVMHGWGSRVLLAVGLGDDTKRGGENSFDHDAGDNES